MKSIYLPFIALFFISCVSKTEIKNDTYKVTYSNGSISFKDVQTGKPFLVNAIIGNVGIDDTVQIADVNHPVWGEGKEMVISETASGNKNKISLYQELPFIMLQRVIENTTDSEIQIEKDSILNGQVSLGDLNALKSMSTAGLKEISEKVGGYVYMTIGSETTYNGIVCGWLTSERGSGIVFSDIKDNEAQLSARIDYGDLRIPAGENVETETLLVGYADDIRNGLEQYADAIAKKKEIVLQPMPTVYCTWYHAKASDEEKIAANSDFVKKELLPFGLNTIQIDDYWQSGTREDGPNRDFSKVDPTGPYPNGMQSTSDYIKNKELISGIWYIPFAGTWNDPAWADRQDYFLKQGKSELNHFPVFNKKFNYTPNYAEGKEPYMARWGGTCLDLTNPKVQEYVRETARVFHKDWGYNYFKMDGLWTGTGTRLQYVNSVYKDDDLGHPSRFNPSITAIEAYAKGLDIIREEVKDNVFLLGCSQTQNMRSFGPAMGRVDAMRVGPDNGANPKSLARGPLFSTRLFFLNKRVWYNDPDPVYVRSTFPIEMAKTSVSWTALTGSLHSSSYQYEELPEERLDILKRSLPSHNLKTVQPVDFLESDPARVWLLTDERDEIRKDIIGLFNWDVNNALNVSYDLDRIELPKADTYIGFDFWENKFMPPFSGSINALLPAGGCKIISVRPIKSHPQVISTSRHLTQGVIDFKNENWDENERTLSGESSLVGRDNYEIRIVVPIGKDSWVIDGIETNLSSDKLEITKTQEGTGIRVSLNSKESVNVSWKIKFHKGAVIQEKVTSIIDLEANIDLDKILVKWNANSSNYRIEKNGTVLGESNKNNFEDKNVELGKEYNYCIQTKGWDGDWSESNCVKIKMPNEYKVPQTPSLPSVYCKQPLYIKGNKAIKINSSYSGSQLTINNNKYAHGIGVGADATLVYNIPKGAKYFVATVGLDDNVIKNNRSSVVMSVLGDVQEMGEPLTELGRTPVLKNDGNRLWNFKIKLDNRLRQIQLIVDGTEDGKNGDEANWINAGFIK